MNRGLSVYLNYEFEAIEDVINKCHNHHFDYVFTSLHIPEINVSEYKEKFIRLCNLCNKYSLILITDVSPRTLSLFDIPDFSVLKEMGITHLRPDFGFNDNEILELAEMFTLVINASTFDHNHLLKLIGMGLDADKVLGCHNFYPKKYTGLSKEKVKSINNFYHSLGIKVIGFVMGDKILRGPLFEGLPTVEELRNDSVFYNSLLLINKLNTDVVIVSDFDISDETLKQFDNYDNGYIEIECSINDEYSNFLKYIHHDRVDNSDFFIRSHESIYLYKSDKKFKPENTTIRRIGDICVSNEKYLRYTGELEIMKTVLPADERVNVIGHTDSPLLEFIDNNTGVLLKKI